MEGVTIKLIETPEEMAAAMAIRFQVFVGEQAVPPEEEADSSDATALHVLALLEGTPIGTGRLVCLPSREAQIGRMAVALSHRRAGVGSQLLSRLEEEARRLSISKATLHAQTYVKAFYASHGYAEVGEVFTEAGIEHVLMWKAI